jgi:hypothetical protein
MVGAVGAVDTIGLANLCDHRGFVYERKHRGASVAAYSRVYLCGGYVSD